MTWILFSRHVPAGLLARATTRGVRAPAHAASLAVFDVEMSSQTSVTFVLHGTQLQGPYALVRFTRQPRNWLLFKRGEE